MKDSDRICGDSDSCSLIMKMMQIVIMCVARDLCPYDAENDADDIGKNCGIHVSQFKYVK